MPVSITVPSVGQAFSTQAVVVDNNFTNLAAWANGGIAVNDVAAATAQSASVNQAGQTVKGSSIVATSQATSSTSFTTLATPDQVTNIVLSAAGLIAVWYQATWQESVSGAAQAAIFLGANQVKLAVQNGAPLVGFASTGGGTANEAVPLATNAFGLFSTTGGTGYTGDVTTGQIVGLSGGTGTAGGPCYIFAAAGTYTVAVQFKASSGTVTASSRRLYVQALSFA